MDFLAIKTRLFLPPQDDLYQLLDQSLTELKDKDVVVVSSRLVAIHQGRCVKVACSTNKDDLIKQEAERFNQLQPHGLTIKSQTLTPYAGIDRANGNGYYILWPEEINQAAKGIWQYLRDKHQLRDLGIIIADSFLLPLRLGLIGISIGFYGFQPLYSYEGQTDLFGRKIIRTNSNLVDSLAAISAPFMGEGDEQTPLLIIRDVPFLKFTDKDMAKTLFIEESDDLYQPLLKSLTQRPERF